MTKLLHAVKLGSPRGRYVRVERETPRGWKLSRVYRASDAPLIELRDDEALTCGCGSYAFRECEPCKAEARGC